MFGRHIFTEDEFVSYIGRRGAFRGLLTWKGTVQVPVNGTLDFLEKLYEENLPLVRSNLERKEKQSAAAKAGGPGGQKADPTVAPTAERKRKAEADTSAHWTWWHSRIKLRSRGRLIRFKANTIPDTRATNT